MKEIQVRDNTYQHLQVLKTNRKKRHRAGEFLVEGVRSIKEAVANGWQIQSFVYTESGLSDWAKELLETVPTEENYRLSEELMAELSGKTDASEILAVIKMKEFGEADDILSENPFVVLFDRPSNKGNLGTMIRSCDALGADCLIVTGHGVDIYDPHVVTSAMGSFFNLPVFRMDEGSSILDFIKRAKETYPTLQVVGTTAHKEVTVSAVDFTTPVILLLGNETMGLSKSLKETSDLLCSIPMVERSYASSFNVGCAASIVMYEIVRQRSEMK